MAPAPDAMLVRRVALRGTSRFRDARILASLYYGQRRKQQPVYEHIMVELDERRIEAFYRERGYFGTRAESEVTRVGPGMVDVTFVVVESAPVRIARVQVAGVPDDAGIDTDAVLRGTGLDTGEIFVHEEYLDAKEALATALDSAGYVHARVDGRVRVDRERRSADIAVLAQPGPRMHFGTLTVRGHERIPITAIIERVTWREGEVFRRDELVATRKALHGLDMFQSVRIDHTPRPESDRIDVTIMVREVKRYEIRLGGGVGVDGASAILETGLQRSSDTRLEVRGRGELTVHSWLDPLMTLDLGVRPGYVVLPGLDEERAFVFEARAAIERRDFILPLVSLGGAASYSLESYEAYAENGLRLGTQLDRRFGDERVHLGLALLGALLDIEPLSGVDPDVLGTGPLLGVIMLQQTVTIERRDDRVDPRRGWFGQLRVEQGRWFEGASGNYIKPFFELRGYTPATERVVIAARVQGGWIGSTADEGGPPITQRFFGGGSSHRGFGTRRLSPVALGTGGQPVPVGGAARLEASLDTRVSLVKLGGAWLGGSFFVDVGNVGDTLDDLLPGNMHVAVGVGLRYQTPIGAIRLDVARRLTRLRPCTPEMCPDPDPDRPLMFHFRVGETF